MTTRPKAHVVGDIALSKVMSVIASAGFSADVVHNDYGEDLFVQTMLENVVDPYKIWIQVKGTENSSRLHSKKHGLHLKISVDHAFRWIRSNDLVVVVIWDITLDKGWWSLPSRNLSEWEIRVESERKHAELLFDSKDEFNLKTLSLIAWTSRINHYYGLLVKADAAQREASLFNRPHTNLVPLVSMDFLRVLGIIEERGLSENYFRMYRNGLNNLRADWNEDEGGSLENASLCLALLATASNLCGQGLPTFAIDCCVHLLSIMLSNPIDRETGHFRGEV